MAAAKLRKLFMLLKFPEIFFYKNSNFKDEWRWIAKFEN